MKSGKWLLCGICLFTLTILPVMDSEAFSSPDLQKNMNCHALSLTPINYLNPEQKQSVLSCDLNEADQAWHEQYGNMHNHDFANGIVYDPS